MPYCPYCGSEVSEGDTFCHNCGARLTGAPIVTGIPKRSSRAPAVIAVAVVVLILFSAIGVILAAAGNNSSQDSGDITRTYKWNYDGNSYTYTLTVARADYDRMMESDIDRTGTVSSDRYTNNGRLVFGVCDYVVVDSYIKKVSADLENMYKEKLGHDLSNEEYVKFVTDFVRLCTTYDNGEANGGYEYWRFPLETLCDRKGDCEDTSILLAALIDARGTEGLRGGILLLPEHAMCAVTRSDLPVSPIYLKHSDIDYLGSGSGVDFYPIETTTDHTTGEGGWPIGLVGDDYIDVYMHLYMGNTDSYYITS